MSNVQFPLKAQEQAKSCLSKGEQLSANGGRALLPNPKGHFCDSPIVIKASNRYLSATGISGIFAPGGSCDPSGTAAWSCCRSFPVLGHTQSYKLSMSLGIRTRVTHPSEECTVSRIHPTESCASFLVVRGARFNNLFFTLE